MWDISLEYVLEEFSLLEQFWFDMKNSLQGHTGSVKGGRIPCLSLNEIGE